MILNEKHVILKTLLIFFISYIKHKYVIMFLQTYIIIQILLSIPSAIVCWMKCKAFALMVGQLFFKKKESKEF